MNCGSQAYPSMTPPHPQSVGDSDLLSIINNNKDKKES